MHHPLFPFLLLLLHLPSHLDLHNGQGSYEHHHHHHLSQRLLSQAQGATIAAPHAHQSPVQPPFDDPATDIIDDVAAVHVHHPVQPPADHHPATDMKVADSVTEGGAGLNSTHLSFDGSIICSRAMEEAIFGRLPRRHASAPGQSSVIFTRFSVSHLRKIDGLSKEVVQVQGTLTLELHSSLNLKGVRGPTLLGLLRHWISPRPRNRSKFFNRPGVQFVEVIGMLDVEIREFSAHVCLDLSHSKQQNDSHVAVIQDCQIEMSWRYPGVRSLLTPAVAGTIKSSRNASDPLYFDPARLFAMFQGSYNYSKLMDSKKFCDHPSSGAFAPELLPYRGVKICSILKVFSEYPFLRDKVCDSGICGPFHGDNGELWMTLMDCDDTSAQAMLNGFFSLGSLKYLNENPVGDTVLPFEGSWCPAVGLLSLMACHRTGNITVEDCSIHIKIWISRTLTLQQRSMLLGEISSLRNSSDPHFFTSLSFRVPFDAYNAYIVQEAQFYNLGLTYTYTRSDLEEDCVKKTNGGSKTALRGKYPRLPDTGYFNFLAQFKSKKEIMHGLVQVLTVGDSFPKRDMDIPQDIPRLLLTNSTSEISFSITMEGEMDHPQTQYSSFAEISAEGLYDLNFGKLCLIGCKDVHIPENSSLNPKDCQILIEIQYPPEDPALSKKHPLSGSISSLRQNSDPLYFDPMEVVSESESYSYESKMVILRRKIEVSVRICMLSAMVIVAVLQISYSKAHSQTLPYISLTMLLILTLNHFIPLWLQVHEMILFSQHNTHLISSSSGMGSWREAIPFFAKGTCNDQTKLAILILTIALFLLHVHLLQLAWGAQGSRLGLESVDIVLREMNILKIYLPIYLMATIAACLLKLMFGYGGLSNSVRVNAAPLEWWAGVRESPLLIGDFFLFPQVIASFMWNTQQKPLHPSFYLGMTCLRWIPHLYNAFILDTLNLDELFTYCRPASRTCEFSQVRAVYVPCGGVALALIIFLQQKFGGRGVLPTRLRMISMVSMKVSQVEHLYL